MQELSSLYRSHFGTDPETIVPITGSASNRNYFRLSSECGVCIGVRGVDKDENHAFLTLARHFRSRGIPVPEVLASSDDGMCYLLEDLGDDVLFDVYAEALKTGEGMGEAEELLCMVMSMLPKLQFEGGEGLDYSVCYPQPSFDRRMVMFDLNYFKYCFLKASGLEFNELKLQDDFERLADDLLTDMVPVQTFMHRDFQPRNVMIKDGMPYFIDFQGGRKGPIFYDVASFVWHARSGFTLRQKEMMLDSYLTALSEYVDMDRPSFMERISVFVLFRTLQVLGAYGFRGWTEHKAAFVVCIPQAIRMLDDLLAGRSCADSGAFHKRYPYLSEVLEDLARLPRFGKAEAAGLTVTVTSFSFRKGIPEDPSGNGGGYVFDCRSIHNPGRYPQYRNLTGMDEDVIRFLEDDGEITGFLEHVYGVVVPHVETYMRRGFSSLMVSFGCTGGQHRSVYCAEHLARHLAVRYPSVSVRLVHREQNVERYVCCPDQAD